MDAIHLALPVHPSYSHHNAIAHSMTHKDRANPFKMQFCYVRCETRLKRNEMKVFSLQCSDVIKYLKTNF